MPSYSGTLNITNGDAVVYLFKKAGILGTHLAWKDVLHEGPVPAGLSFAEMSRVRAEYMAGRGYGSAIKVYREFEQRATLVAQAAQFDEIVLWFEHDLYDQLQLLQILAVLASLDLDPGKVSIVQSDAYLGSMTADELVALHPRRKVVTSGLHAVALKSWHAFTAATPDQLFEQTRVESHGLPFMRAALRRLCEEYPAPGDGLSRTERQALASVAQGTARNRDEVFGRAQAREEAPFSGDASFFRVLKDLGSEPGALIEEGTDGALISTALGRRVLAGDLDWSEERPIDRWIGGVHLSPGHLIRFDNDRGSFVV